MGTERRLRDSIDSDLAATTDDITADARRIEHIEHLRRSLAIDDPQRVGLSRESTALAEGLVRKTKGQGALEIEARRARSN